MGKFLRSERAFRRLLGDMRMQIAPINLELPVNRPPEFVVRDHSADRAFDEQFRVTRTPGPGVFGFVSTDESGKAHEALLFFLLARQAHFLRVDHDDEVTGVDMRRVNGLFFAAQKIGGFHGHLTEDLIVGVDDPPFAWHFIGFCGKRLHQGERGRKLRAWVEVSTASWWVRAEATRDSLGSGGRNLAGTPRAYNYYNAPLVSLPAFFCIG